MINTNAAVVVVPDTSILWHKDKRHPVHPSFTSFIKEWSERIQIDLIIPAVVHGELIFQQTESALRALGRAESELNQVRSTTHVPYRKVVGERKIREAVLRKIQQWMDSQGARICSTPVKEIDWKAIIQKSINRIPPFEYDREEEKGFRDAMILETAYSIARGCKKDTRICLISSDECMLNAARNEQKNISHLHIFESIEAFSANLKLYGEEIEGNLLERIQPIANAYFVRGVDGPSMIEKHGIIESIKKKFSDNLQEPTFVVGPLQSLLGDSAPIAVWDQQLKEEYRISSSRFKSRSKNEFHWENSIAVLRRFMPCAPMTWLIPSDQRIPYLSAVEVIVEWKVDIAADGLFSNDKIVDITLLRENFNTLTKEICRHYNLKEGL